MAENNIIIKITSEANLDAAQKQLKELTEKAQAQEEAMRDLSNAEKEDAQSIKQLGLSQEQLAKALKKNKDYYSDLRNQKKADVSETKKSIKELENQVKAYKTLNGQSGRMVTQLRAMREQLMRMEEAGEFGTQAFMDLSIAAGKLEDQIGDTQQRIRVLASDTKEIDAVMGLGDGLAGAFYVATSGAELLGSDIEGLQNAFYKVQAAMAVVSGTQQIFNALNKDSAAMVVLNTALTKLLSKSKKESAAATLTDAGASISDTGAKGAQAAATATATTAQMSLNAAMKANPIGVIIALVLAAVAAVAALGIGIYKLVHYFSAAGEAERDYAKAAKELEKVQAQNAVGAAKRAYERQQQIQAVDNAEENALDNAKNRNASELEMAQIKSNHAKQRAEQAQKYTNDEIARNQKEVAQLKKMVDAKQREVNAYKDGSKKKKKAQEELNDVEQQYYDALQKSKDLEQENIDAQRASADAALELKQQREQLQQQLQQANIDLMRDGAAKEIAQIKLNYKDQLKTIQGSSDEEVALRKKILAKQAKEIADVRNKYALQEQQAAIQEQKNLLKVMSQSGGTEEDYTKEIALTKQIAEAEAQARIDALDKSAMSESAYKEEVESIRLELADTLRSIDEQEVQRMNENAQRRTEIAIQEAESRKNALTGAESVEEQKAVVQDYYYVLERQIEENAEIERQAVNRSTDTAEVKAEKIKQIDAKMHADIAENTKNANQELIEIDTQYISELERKASDASDAVSSAYFGNKLDALEANLDAQIELQRANLENVESLYEQGLISYQDYEQRKWDIMKEMGDAQADYQAEKMQTILDGFVTALDYMQQVSDLAFEALGNNVQAELDALDEMYTTDAQEAKENANKKYISEKEYEKKKADLQMKQAKYAKAQAIINAGISTAMAIVTTLAQLGATPWGIAASVIAGAMGAAQIAIIASKPLAQYAKGRKGGKGEYAIVGEKGAELMYIPQGASIVPNNKINNMDSWGDYGVPKLNIPEIPHADNDILNTVMQFQPIDYDRLGKAVAANLPKQKSVHVNIDKSGITVQSGNDKRTYLNQKYFGQWR